MEGLHFFRAYPIQEFSLTTFRKGQKQAETQLVTYEKIKAPFLIVNIGSGVSMVKIEAKS